jgi:hypothetical protein
MNFLSLFGERYFLYCSINVPMNTNRILLLSFGCFISAASYAAASNFSFSDKFTAAVFAQRSFARHKFSPEEDQELKVLVTQFGENNWAKIASFMPGRSPRQCRERWKNYVNPSLDFSPWTSEEDDLLLQKCQEFGKKWWKIALLLGNRSKNSCRNRWDALQRRVSKVQPLPPRSQPQSPPQSQLQQNFFDCSNFGDDDLLFF